MPAFSAAPVVDNPSPDISQIISIVDKIVVEQPPDQGAAAVHLQLTSRLGSQLADGRRDLTGEDSRVRPPRSVSVVDATYLGREFKAAAMGLMPGSATAPQASQKRAKLLMI